MKATVRPMNAFGIPIEMDERVVFSGDFEIIEDPHSPYHVHSPVACVVCPPLQHILYQISVLWFAGNSMGVRGVEVIGCAQYLQTWDITLDWRSYAPDKSRTRKRLSGRLGTRCYEAPLLDFAQEGNSCPLSERRPASK
jgi:hypothetical protein